MRYSNFFGKFLLNKKLGPETHRYLIKFNETRHMARKLGPEYGVEGEFFVDGTGLYGTTVPADMPDRPPSTQPGLWCPWRPSDDGMHIVWDERDHLFSKLTWCHKWLEYIINNFLGPKGYVLNGNLRWEGKDPGNTGTIMVFDNSILTLLSLIQKKIREIMKTSGKSNIRIRTFLKNSENLPLLLGLDKELDAFISHRLNCQSPVE
jgi:hypothetical protein